MAFCRVGDETFQPYVTAEYVEQQLQQKLVLNVYFAFDVRYEETRIIFKVLFYYTNELVQLCSETLKIVGRTCVS